MKGLYTRGSQRFKQCEESVMEYVCKDMEPLTTVDRQGLKLCFGNDLTNPAIWSVILNCTVQKNSESVQTLAKNGRKMADVQP